jgi:hypothetical protein
MTSGNYLIYPTLIQWNYIYRYLEDSSITSVYVTNNMACSGSRSKYISNCQMMVDNIFRIFVFLKVTGLEANSEKTKYMFMSCHQTAGQSNYIRVANKSFEKVSKFKYLGATLTYQNCIHEEISSRLNLGNASYHAVQNLLSSHLLSRNVKKKQNYNLTCGFVWV